MLDRQSCKCIKILTKGDQRSISGLSALKSEPTIRYFPDFGRSRHWPGGFQGSLCPANYEFTCAKISRSQRKSGLTGCSAEWPTTGERQDWARSDICLTLAERQQSPLNILWHQVLGMAALSWHTVRAGPFCVGGTLCNLICKTPTPAFHPFWID